MKLFKDLPSTDTPINAENLNQIQDNLVVVSATEPTGDNREKVWMQKGKNLIKGFRAGYGFNAIIGQYEIASMFSSTEAIDVEVGQTYIFSHSIGHIGGGVHCLDANNNHVETLNQDTITSPFTITNPNCKKVVIVAWDPNNNASVNETWMQLEQNTVATAYEAYIEPKIYVKNDNSVYEEFISKENLVNYSTGEQRIGTWINGKPLYEKVIDGITPNTTTDTKVFDIPNIETLVNIKGMIDNWLPINSIVSPENSSILYSQADGFMMAIGSSQMNKPFRAIVEYTKTTD